LILVFMQRKGGKERRMLARHKWERERKKPRRWVNELANSFSSFLLRLEGRKKKRGKKRMWGASGHHQTAPSRRSQKKKEGRRKEACLPPLYFPRNLADPLREGKEGRKKEDNSENLPRSILGKGKRGENVGSARRRLEIVLDRRWS